jgi:hypothetical protein
MKILIVSEMSVPYAVGGGEVRYGLLTRELARRGERELGEAHRRTLSDPSGSRKRAS